MANLSIRGLDHEALNELKTRASRENASVNTLVLQLIDQGLGRQRVKPGMRRHSDLDSLAGSWQQNDAAAFESATAPMREVDKQLWR